MLYKRGCIKNLRGLIFEGQYQHWACRFNDSHQLSPRLGSVDESHHQSQVWFAKPDLRGPHGHRALQPWWWRPWLINKISHVQRARNAAQEVPKPGPTKWGINQSALGFGVLEIDQPWIKQQERVNLLGASRRKKQKIVKQLIFIKT